MDKLDKHIDDLFRSKLSEAEMPGVAPETEWLKLSKTIRQRNFMRFAPGSFNIYNLIATIGITATLGIFIFQGNHNEDNDPSAEKNISIVDSIQNTKSSPVVDSTLILKPIDKKQEEVTRKNVVKKCIENSNNETKTTPAESTKTHDDKPITIVKDSITETISSPDSIKPLAPPVVSDTIITIDTIRVKKKGVKFSRKKTTF